MRQVIEQRIPGGCQTPQAQVELSQAVVREAARRLEFSALDELEHILSQAHEGLVALAGAGVLAEIAFLLRDPYGVCGAAAVLEPYSVEDFHAVDLTRLSLLANPKGFACLEMTYVDMVMAHAIVGEEWLASLATDALEVIQLNRGVSGEGRVNGWEDADESDGGQS